MITVYKPLKYNEAVQKKLKCKTEPAPWLHVIVFREKDTVSFAIYIWDSREIIESGSLNLPTNFADKLFSSFDRSFRKEHDIQSTIDNFEQVVGKGAKQFNALLFDNVDSSGSYKPRARKNWFKILS